jgi:poly [ADP-ribose] polymerase 2/3/4
MPPKRRAAAAKDAPAPAKPLEGCVLALSGKFAAYGHSHGSLEALVRDLGGTVMASVNPKTTHVICTDDEYEIDSKKVADGKARDLPLLGPQWVIDCSSQSKKVDPTWYACGKSSSTAGAANGAIKSTATNGTASQDAAASDDTTTNGKKRPIAIAASDDKDEPQSKKTRATKGTKGTKADAKAKAEPKAKAKGKAAAKAIKDEPEDEPDDKPEDKSEEQVEEEMVAEGQFLKKKDTVIELDEHCDPKLGQVYVDDEGMIWDASLNQSNSSANNNKFYRVQVRRFLQDKPIHLSLVVTDSISPGHV